MRSKAVLETRKLKRKEERMNFESLGQAGAFIRSDAKQSIKRRGGRKRKRKRSGQRGMIRAATNKSASRAGSAPHTRKGLLKRAILFAIERRRGSVVIGPSAMVADDVGAAHEHGGRFRKRRYPRRPFMLPALMKNMEKIPRAWRARYR
jgi:hypothetical protein